MKYQQHSLLLQIGLGLEAHTPEFLVSRFGLWIGAAIKGR